jgi:hypothetical protein
VKESNPALCPFQSRKTGAAAGYAGIVVAVWDALEARDPVSAACNRPPERTWSTVKRHPIASSARSSAREDGIAARVLATTTLPGKHFCNTSFLLAAIASWSVPVLVKMSWKVGIALCAR